MPQKSFPGSGVTDDFERRYSIDSRSKARDRVSFAT